MIAQIHRKHDPPKAFHGVNWDSPQAKGLLYWWPGGYGQLGERTVYREVLRGRHASTQNPAATTAQVVAGSWGPCWDSLDNNINGGVWVGESLLYGRSTFTVSQWCWEDTVSATDCGLCNSWTSGTRTILLRSGASGTMEYFLYLSTSGQVGGGRTTAARVAKKWNLVVATYDGATTRLFINDVLSPTTGNGTGTVGEGDSGQLNWCGAYNSTSGEDMNGLVRDCRIYDHALEYGEVLQIYRNPFDLFRRQPEFVPTAAGEAPAGSILPLLNHYISG